MVSITGAGAYGGVAGETLAFTAAAKDAYGNPRRPAASFLDDASFEIFRDGDAVHVVNATAVASAATPGALDATYVVEDTGAYWLEVRVRGTPIRGSPFALDVSRRPAPVLSPPSSRTR